MDATRCIIVHLAATQSLQHTICDDTIPLWYYGVVVGVVAVILVQVCIHAEALLSLSAARTTSPIIQISQAIQD